MDAPPRTPDEPMAFTRTELWGGAGWAWTAFMAQTVLALVVVSVVNDVVIRDPGAGSYTAMFLPYAVGIAILFGGPISLAVMAAAVPLVGLLARRLRTTRPLGRHVLLQALVGAAIGLVAFAAFGLAVGSAGWPTWYWLLGLVTVQITTSSTLIGWFIASSRARQELDAAQPLALVASG